MTMTTYTLKKRTFERESVLTFYKTNIPVNADDLQQLKAEIVSQLKNPLDLRGNGDVVLLVDMSDMTYIVQVIDSPKAPYIHRLPASITA